MRLAWEGLKRERLINGCRPQWDNSTSIFDHDSTAGPLQLKLGLRQSQVFQKLGALFQGSGVWGHAKDSEVSQTMDVSPNHTFVHSPLRSFWCSSLKAIALIVRKGKTNVFHQYTIWCVCIEFICTLNSYNIYNYIYIYIYMRSLVQMRKTCLYWICWGKNALNSKPSEASYTFYTIIMYTYIYIYNYIMVYVLILGDFL